MGAAAALLAGCAFGFSCEGGEPQTPHMGRWSALLMHGLVFELVHIFVYGYGFRGGTWFVMALIYGYAFQRTRSVAIPVLMHATSLVLYKVSLWLLAP
jgi:membrane protease YdiL (CAAX protease family)